MPSAGRQRFTRGDHFDLLEKRIFLFSVFIFLYWFYVRLFFETFHEPLSLEEGTLAEADLGFILDRREEVIQAP